LFGTGHEQGPAGDVRIQFNAMIGISTGSSKTTGAAPLGNLANFFALVIELWPPLPVATSKNHRGKWPGMIMHIVGVALEKLVNKDVEWETVSVSEKHIVAFQVRFPIQSIHDHTVSTQAFE
jgi:hypothetical protein